ncbi:MAG: hypothetical protein JWM82_666 [Myxococcales bacterium]|nr:hypothetical protein [Myxococcales bacterium]
MTIVRGLAGVLVFGMAAMAGAAAPPKAPAEAAPRERRLHVASAEASSYLVNDWNKFQENYLPLYVGDDDPKTAWTLKTEGLGEWLRVHVTPMGGATKVRLKVRNGYQKTEKLWAANSRAHGLTVVLLPSKKTVDVDLTDTSGWQELALEQPAGALEAIELRVRSVYAGKKYDDLCLSDVQIFVTATTPDNPAYEKARLDKIAAWKKDRLDAAKLFQSDLGKTMPVAPQYVASGGDLKQDEEGQDLPRSAHVNGRDCHDSLCYLGNEVAQAAGDAKSSPSRGRKLARELATLRFAGMTAVRISTRDKRPVPQIDGICLPSLDSCLEDACDDRLPLPAQLGYLDARSLVTTEQSGLPTADDVLALKIPACKRQEPTTFAYVSRDANAADGTPGLVRAVLLVTCGLVEGREGMFPHSRPQLLVYGDQGMLDLIADASHGAILEWNHDGAGPKLASARVNTDAATPLIFTAATSVATK